MIPTDPFPQNYPFNAFELLSVLPGEAVWVVFGLVMIVYAVYSAILTFHWIEYAARAPLIYPAMAAYFGGSAILIAFMFFSAVAMQSI